MTPVAAPLGSGFSRNSIAGDVAHTKHIGPALAVSLRNMCFRFCCCKRSAVSVAITEAMSCGRFRRWTGFRLSARRHRVNRQAVRSPVAALHRVSATAILRECSPAKSFIGLLGAGGRLQQ